MSTPLNWREIEELCAWISPKIEGLYVDRVIVPERPEFMDGFLKNEWVIRLHSREKDHAFLFSTRPRRPYFSLLNGKGPKSATEGTRAGFDLALGKFLDGRKVLALDAVERERTAVLWFTGDDEKVLGLVLTLIPALPEALLIEAPAKVLKSNESKLTKFLHSKKLTVLARSRNVEKQDDFIFPDGSKSPLDLILRREILPNLQGYNEILEQELLDEAWEMRLTRARQRLVTDLKQAKTRARQNETTLREASTEPDYSHFGDLLKASMGKDSAQKNPSTKKTRKVFDWNIGEEVEIPCDPKLSLKDQVEKFYSAAKRKARRISEAKLRVDTWKEKETNLLKLQSQIDSLSLSKLRSDSKKIDLKTALPILQKIEENLGLSVGGPIRKELKATQSWPGKIFKSKEGLPILVGRSRDENLELTFKFAKGNDLWMHVRGRPGSHVVIPLREKKNASLETLLDAAYLCIHYSKGESWGKTEVDYTHKKHVKRIKDSTEASYVNNKTLLVELNKPRLKELLGQDSEG